MTRCYKKNKLNEAGSFQNPLSGIPLNHLSLLIECFYVKLIFAQNFK